MVVLTERQNVQMDQHVVVQWNKPVINKHNPHHAHTISNHTHEPQDLYNLASVLNRMDSGSSFEGCGHAIGF